jgi:hypothetical protein
MRTVRRAQIRGKLKLEKTASSHVNLAMHHDPCSSQEMMSKSKFKMVAAKGLLPWLATRGQKKDGNVLIFSVLQCTNWCIWKFS